MFELKKEVKEVINKELARANKQFPLFASNHEAYGVILEEMEETMFELNCAKEMLSIFWEEVKYDDAEAEYIESLEKGRNRMLLCACEAIQTSAMFEKALCSNYERARKREDESKKWQEEFKELLRKHGNTKSEEREKQRQVNSNKSIGVGEAKRPTLPRSYPKVDTSVLDSLQRYIKP